MKRLKLNLELYSRMYLIRKSEELIISHYGENDMKTPMHMSMGEEAIAVGLCHALGADGLVCGYYRSHGLYIAKSNDTDGFFGEMCGKVNGSSRGKAGSMHLAAPEHGLICTSAVVGSTIAPAVGIALAEKMKGTNRIAAAYFGEGAMDEGVFWESLNFACLKKLPMLFVCIDNGFAIDVPVQTRQGFVRVSDIVSKYNCKVFDSDSTDVEEIYNIVLEAISCSKINNQPVFLRLECYRYLQHCGTNQDFDKGFRSKEDFARWLKRDPIELQKQKLLQFEAALEIKKIEEEMTAQATLSLERAKAAPSPDLSELHEGVFYGQ